MKHNEREKIENKVIEFDLSTDWIDEKWTREANESRDSSL